jgi:hypothetical protein
VGTRDGGGLLCHHQQDVSQRRENLHCDRMGNSSRRVLQSMLVFSNFGCKGPFGADWQTYRKTTTNGSFFRFDPYILC